jgi:tetratricopeptide (TPR) repeat protein
VVDFTWIGHHRGRFAVKWKLMNTVAAVLTLAMCAQARPGGQTPKDDLFDKGKALSTREKWPEAISCFREFVAGHPDDPRASEARYWIGYCLVKSDEYDDAVQELTPFEADLKKDKWADDALLQLGHAYRGNDHHDQALAAWKRLLDQHVDSIWRSEAALQIIDVLYSKKDYAACLPYCELLVKAVADFAAISQARYIGAYCLNALSRYDEADRWMRQWFSPDDALEAGWRRVLSAQRELRQGRVDNALGAINAVGLEFPDLDRDDRIDLTVRVATMLTRENQPARARDMLIAAINHSSVQSEENVEGLLEQLKEASSGDVSFLSMLERLASDANVPFLARIVVRERRVDALCEDERADDAEALLRRALAEDKEEYARFRAAIRLAELLDDEQEDKTEAVRVLKDILSSLKRSDLAHRAREAIEGLEKKTDDDRE